MWLKSKPVCLSQRPNPFASNKITGNLRLTYSIVLGNIVLTPWNWVSAHSASAHPTGLAAQAFKLQYQPPHNHQYDLLNMIHSNEQTHGAVYQGDWHFIFLGTKKTWCWAQICGSYLHCREVIFPSAEKLGDVQLMTPPCREWLYIHPELSPPKVYSLNTALSLLHNKLQISMKTAHFLPHIRGRKVENFPDGRFLRAKLSGRQKSA